jgi:hypothetical protein
MGKRYEIRQLKATDVFKMTSILSKIGVKNFKELLTQERLDLLKGEEKQAASMQLVMDALDILLENIEKCEEQLYKFFASLIGATMKEVKEMSAAEFMNLAYDVFTSEGFLDFFKAALRSQK